jgi:hypothetical protein
MCEAVEESREVYPMVAGHSGGQVKRGNPCTKFADVRNAYKKTNGLLRSEAKITLLDPYSYLLFLRDFSTICFG